MIATLIKKVHNFIIKRLVIRQLKVQDNAVYITFDDGPEPGVTEFVLSELEKYQFKATFFCKGLNAVSHPDLLEQLRKNQHSLGNHTYSHIHAFETPTNNYVEDVNMAYEVLHTNLFRPPWGSLTFATYLKLRNQKIIYWSLDSGDSKLEKFNFDKEFTRLCSGTKKGSVVLFHFCQRHERETRKILPAYLKWLSENGYISKHL